MKPMKQSESISKLAAALVAAQGEMRSVAKDAKNPDFRSTYASLDAIVLQTRPLLAKHGLAIVQGATTPHSDETGRIAAIAVETMLVHSSGEWLSNTAIMPVVGRMLKGGGRAEPDPQAGGSALTYGRRYGLSALLSLATGDDDDGNAASVGAKRSQGVSRPAAAHSAPSGAASVPASAPVSGPVMPFGKSRGKPLSEVPDEVIVTAIKWCREKGDPDRYAEFIATAEEYLDARRELSGAVA